MPLRRVECVTCHDGKNPCGDRATGHKWQPAHRRLCDTANEFGPLPAAKTWQLSRHG